MDSPEPVEPSYYEVALTNRQLLVAFVALLVCLVAAFFSGVIVGRGGVAEREQVARATPAANPNEPALEEFKFFSEQRGGTATAAPRATPSPAARATVAATPRATPEPPPVAISEVEPTATPVPTATRAGPPRPTAAAGSFYVQVTSTGDEAKAKRIQQDLAGRGLKGFLSPVTRDGKPLYRIRLGPFPSRAEAQASADRARRLYREAIVTDKP